jgi:hypothetical protein
MHQRRRYAWDEPTLSGTLLGASVRLIVRCSGIDPSVGSPALAVSRPRAHPADWTLLEAAD